MIDIPAIQSALGEFGIDGWLLYDFRGSNLLAQRVLGLAPSDVGSRRYAYCIPAKGEPRKLVHRIEEGALAGLPGSKTVYLKWQEFEAGLGRLLSGLKRVALEYSPHNAIPYVSRVDAGTVELIKRLGVEIVSSGDLIQVFEAAWDDEQERSHFDAAVHTDAAYSRAWRFIADAVRRGTIIDEVAVQAEILKHFAENGLETEHPPIVAVGPHAGNPHHETSSGPGSEIREGDFVLIDLWAKLQKPRAVYSDLTRVGFVGKSVPPRIHRNLPDRGQGPRHGHRNGARRLCREAADCRLRSRPGVPAGDRDGRLRRSLRPSHGAQHRPGDARQRRQHRRSGNARHSPAPAADLLLDRAGHLPARVRHPQRSERLHRRRQQSSRDGRTDPERLSSRS